MVCIKLPRFFGFQDYSNQKIASFGKFLSKFAFFGNLLTVNYLEMKINLKNHVRYLYHFSKHRHLSIGIM